MRVRRENISKGNRLGKRLPLSVFVKEGYLQEANRRFFHPLGLALTVTQATSGKLTKLWVQDFRADPEGLVFADLTDRESRHKARTVSQEWHRKGVLRKLALNYIIQPIGRRTPKDCSLRDQLKKCAGNQSVDGKGINAAENKRRSRRAC